MRCTQCNHLSKLEPQCQESTMSQNLMLCNIFETVRSPTTRSTRKVIVATVQCRAAPQYFLNQAKRKKRQPHAQQHLSTDLSARHDKAAQNSLRKDSKEKPTQASKVYGYHLACQSTHYFPTKKELFSKLSSRFTQVLFPQRQMNLDSPSLFLTRRPEIRRQDIRAESAPS